ncbi:YceI family protein [Corynebacterium sp. sy039]|uniref:YceI family protein n=1 Tax=Corynebacterium sp. sy039 TaxID=2599641 RepID=UPI0011B3CF04|nr:YceI family protein [Corynebacterium sp. sy039]QDZ42586.1 YceI family protein [Corynebacterium sp. sy039]
MDKKRKIIIFSTVAAVILLSTFALVTVLYPLFNGPGIKTEELDASKAQPASTDVDGHWQIAYGSAPNISSVGFTFHEILPAEKRITSGSTQSIRGNVYVENKTLTSGRIEVNMDDISSDQEKRDINVRSKIFETDKYPTATFDVAEKVDLSTIGDHAEVAEIDVPGDLSIHGKTHRVVPTFKVVRSGKQIILSTTIPINRLDYDVQTPEFVAAKIDENGEINVRLTLEK